MKTEISVLYESKAFKKDNTFLKKVIILIKIGKDYEVVQVHYVEIAKDSQAPQ